MPAAYIEAAQSLGGLSHHVVDFGHVAHVALQLRHVRSNEPVRTAIEMVCATCGAEGVS